MLLKFFKFKNTIISRYLLSNLFIFFFAITFIIALIVFGNQFVLTTQESISIGIPIKELMPLVGFNMLRDIPIILTLSLFLSIIITISQLYKNSEAVVMNSIGLGDRAFMNLIKPIVFFTFIIIFYLTIFAVPWAKQQKSNAEDVTVNASEFSFITEGKFESFKNGEIVFYASESKINDIVGEQNMEEIFIYALNNKIPTIVLAPEAKKYTDATNNSTYLRLKNGTRYEGLPGDENINILNFEKYDLEIVSGDVQKSITNFSEIEERNTIDLLREGGKNANAEIQWRISQPISVLILSVFGIFLGKSSPRNGKGINLILGVVVFMLYNNALLVAKSAIESGQLSPLIGMWSIHLLLLLFLIIFYQFRQGKVAYFIDKIAFFNIKEKSHV
ncbi:LPS export ABC transporter permease LptF [Candidatus Thioglobus sp.]|nr:LPS export ABC transporter permease LptF [Candidatus Thioglobus sp.]MDC3391464.1 LPS export ABC transporter permease LptF [Candidatus Thioglobus sp.]